MELLFTVLAPVQFDFTIQTNKHMALLNTFITLKIVTPHF